MSKFNVYIGDYIRILSWDGFDACEWQDDFEKVFKVIGFAEDFSIIGFYKHWKVVTNKYDYVSFKDMLLLPMSESPYLILNEKLSNGIDIIHPIFVYIDSELSRENSLNKLLK